MEKKISNNLIEFEKIINYNFKNKTLLSQALSHSSYANENYKKEIESNERLEFLGDAVLELVISDFIYNEYIEMTEGELTKLRASIVCEPTLAQKAKELKISDYIMLSKGEKSSGGNMRDSLLADTFEAIIGAVYLDSSIETVKEYIINIMKPVILELQNSFRTMDYKTYLQELVQKNSRETVKYKIVDEIGPDHSKQFVAEAIHRNIRMGKGSGKTKKEAEQNAALDALNKNKHKYK